MLSVKLLYVGKLKDAHYRMAAAEYEKRLAGLCKFETEEIQEFRLPKNPSMAQIEEGLCREGEQLLQKASGNIFPLCIEGRAISSEDLAGLMKSSMEYPGAISFIIGSSFGLSEQVKKSGSCISMSKMTFPHGLAQVILTEQIYRSLQILSGGKYHK